MNVRIKTILLAALLPMPVSADEPSSRPEADTPSNWAAFRCDDRTRRQCGDMRDCDEATFHWAMCGRSGLDRDADNMPCETVCPRCLHEPKGQ